MPTFETLLAVSLAGLALSITPGPSMLYVLSRTVGQDRAAGLASAFGLALGGVVLAIATAMGLAAVFEQAAWLVETLRIAGSLYLIYLGWGLIRGARNSSRAKLEVSEAVKPKSFGAIVWQGVVVEVLNPKTVLFFALFLPPFVVASEPGTGSVELQLLILGALVPLTAIPSDIFVVLMGGSLTGVLNRKQKAREWLAWGSGLTLIFIAANLHIGLI